MDSTINSNDNLNTKTAYSPGSSEECVKRNSASEEPVDIIAVMADNCNLLKSDTVEIENDGKGFFSAIPDSDQCISEEDTNTDKCNIKDSKSTLKVESVISNHRHISEPFKKPLTVGNKGQIAKISKRVSLNGPSEISEVNRCKSAEKKLNCQNFVVPFQKQRDNSVPIPYKEPHWSCMLTEPYSLEVLKSGVIIETIDLSSKPFYVFGRQSNCDFQLGHPTVSRHHAVMQHRAEADILTEDRSSICKDAGVYIYDLGSTHGTFVNKKLILKQRYIRLHVGYMVRFGGSTRSYILLGPETDVEKESEKSVTELKAEAQHKKNARTAGELWETPEETEREEEDQGVDWGLGEDADEESDLSENPFAATQNEELYLDDPKKSLRGWFEREGEELEYIVEEKSFGQFLCQVKLPLDDAHGKPLLAEALVKGKKKEAVVQCALEACRILDRLGLLRQANHESKKRKARNWEDDDFYESDEDTFLDRTGTVERKREKRMRSAGKLETKAETYDSLLKKHEEILQKLKDVEAAVKREKRREVQLPEEMETAEEEEDALDAFMSSLTQKTHVDKVNIRRLKVCLAELQQEEAHLRRLINIARPTSMPEVLHPQMLPECKAQGDQVSREENSTALHSKKQDMSMIDSQKKLSKSMLEENMKASIQYTDGHDVEIETGEKESFKKEIPKSLPSHFENDSTENEKKTVADIINLDETVKVKTNFQPKIHGPALIIEAGKAREFQHGEPSQVHNRSAIKKSMVKNTKKKDESDRDYSMWLPPNNQTGDGKTELNDKYGY